MINIRIVILIFLFSAEFLYGGSSTIFLPIGKERSDLSQLNNLIISRFGERRTSYKSGHLHSGIDLKAQYNDAVFPVAYGKVADVYGEFPNKTVFIEHRNWSGKIYYSAYVHLEDICIVPGDLVNADTKLGRIFSRDELRKSNFGTLPHVHLEIRKSISDGGQATYNCMTNEELSKYFINPETFFNQYITGERYEQRP